MKDYADFLQKFATYTAHKSIRWAVIGSHAMNAHAKLNGLERPRDAHDLDLIAVLPKHLDDEFRTWLDRKSCWVYERWGLGAVHVWCDDGKQIDIFTKVDAVEIDNAIEGEVLGVACPIVSWKDAQAALERWAADTCKPGHPRHFDHQKYRDGADWFMGNDPNQA